jgi:light-regulated signal transduction histidine kinase (bacteriophytochrome)
MDDTDEYAKRFDNFMYGLMIAQIEGMPHFKKGKEQLINLGSSLFKVYYLKNTANYEMDFGPEDILQRFVRGDEARSTEGSGLGLSIAQSFTELCRGQFSITIDGDLFKVELRFNRLT